MACLTQNARAYEYVFNFADCESTKDGNNVTYTLKNQDGKTLVEVVFMTDPNFITNNPGLTGPSRVHLADDNSGRLVVPSGTKIRVYMRDGYNLREVWLGKIGNSENNVCGQEFDNGATMDDVRDLEHLWNGGTDEHLFVRGIKGTFTATMFATSNNLSKLDRTDRDYYFGPSITVCSEGITMEDLTNADHNVRLMNHTIVDEVVGVDVKNVNNQDYLIVRSANQLSPKYRQTMRPDQESFKDENGNVYEWSNPNTPQYAWMMVKIDNPSFYKGKKFKNMRGKFCAFEANPYHVYWLNPFMQVASADVNSIEFTGEETTTRNEYPLANLVQPKDDQYFMLKPVLCELCDIKDVMRSHGDHFIYVPDRNAMMPEKTITDENGITQIVPQANFYVDNNISYGQDYSYASFLDNEGVKPYEKSDRELINGQSYSFGWQLYDKVYDFDNSLIVAAHHGDKTNYVYPLPIPNDNYTQSVGRRVINIVGEGELKAYNSDFYVGQENYWSRYQYSANRNAYRNDISFTFSKPNNNPWVSTGQDLILDVWRCDDMGNKLAKIATIINDQYDARKFTVTSTVDAKEAKDDPSLAPTALGEGISAPYFPSNEQFLIGAQVGQEYISRLYLSDMFYSGSMNCANDNRMLSSDYQYRIEASKDGITSVVGFAPVYKTNTNVATRANYTKAEVDADLYNTLKENNKAKINFTPNMAKAMTEYRVYKGDATQGENFANIASSAIVLNNNFLDQAIEDDIVDGTVYVPELYTEYNDNTYGCYKQSVSDASVTLSVKSIVAADFTNDENGTRYIHAAIDLSSVINNTDKDSRYLLRVWRQVGNGEKVLLNGQEEAWETNYGELQYTGLNKDTFAKTNPNDPFTLYDTFEAVTSKPSAAPGLKAYGDMVNIEDVKYTVALYVKDDASGKYYVKTDEITPATSIPTAISTIAGSAQVESVRYINVAGMESDKPFAGMNIVVTRYSNGTTTITKMIK